MFDPDLEAGEFYDIKNITPLFTPGNWVIVKNLEMSRNSFAHHTHPDFVYGQSVARCIRFKSVND